MVNIQTATTYNIFQIPWGEELSIGLEDMRLLIQQLTWTKVQHAFIIQFSEIRSEGQAIAASWYAKWKGGWVDGGLLWSIPLIVCSNSSTTERYLLEKSL